MHFSEMPVLLHGVAQCLSPCGRAGENLQFAAAVIVKPLDAPLAGRLAILENLGRLCAGLARLCHHVSGSELCRRARGIAAPPPLGGWGISDESRTADGRGTCHGHAY